MYRQGMNGSERSAQLRYERCDDAVAESSGQRVVVLHADAAEISTLSPVGAIVWAALPATRSTILEHLADRFREVDSNVLADDLDRFLVEMIDLGLVVAVDADG